ncbi:MAG TPA: MgtC/SapB family protein [Rhodothermales bacterium]|nr:MgtC/SapB family protein [Rhodothermales bacterium]
MLDTALSDLVLLAEGLLALALGGVVGWEREREGKDAGLRTMMLVSFASFLFLKVSLLAGAVDPTVDDATQPDPVRAIQAIATGLGFVGGGLVFRDRGDKRIRGVTTAAAILAVSPVGIAVALGHYVLAAGTALILYFVLGRLERVEKHLA